MKAQPVKINGKDYPVKYGFAALRKFSDVTGTTLQQLDKLATEMTMTQAIALVYAGLCDGHRVTNQEFDMNLDDVADLMDEDSEAMTKVLDVFALSMSDNKKKTNSKASKKK